ncbi:hypothetical protein EYF80_031687 [Liparis tanakae]|uniref:Uncharacterized protein n=1 Tax=Liparis tanakae TaxID=230148 RepID=A0A4Z2GWX7_9TELE|nr:hypothetical protein EYF80_031687 [Liparis tanakae]
MSLSAVLVSLRATPSADIDSQSATASSANSRGGLAKIGHKLIQIRALSSALSSSLTFPPGGTSSLSREIL